MSLPLGVNVGDYVEVTTNRPEYNEQLWLVHDEQTVEGRVTLRRIANPNDDNDEQCHQKLIAVRKDAVHPVALVPAHVSLPLDADFATMQRFLCADGARNGGENGERRFSFPRVNQWIRLPGLGGNAVMLREASNPDDLTSALYPGLQGYELWFYSAWEEQIIQVIECDILKLCPARQVWPWCAWCH